MRPATLLVLATALASSAFAQKKPLTHDVYDSWQSVTGQRISNDGKWVAYGISPQEGDNQYTVRSVSGSTVFTFERGLNVSFSEDSNYLIATIVPAAETVKEETKKKVKPEEKTKNDLLIINLATGEKTVINRVTSYSIADEDNGWFVYRPEKPLPEKKEEEKKDGSLDQEPAKQQEPAQEEKKEEEKKKKGHSDGYKVVARNLTTGEEVVFETVSTYTFNKDGSRMYYANSPKELEGHGVFAYSFSDGSTTPILEGLAQYLRITLDEEAENMAILTDRDDYRSEKPSHSIYVHNVKAGTTKKVAQEGMKGVDEGWWVPSSAGMRWENDSKWIVIGLQQKPVEEPKDETPEDEKVSLDVWSWTDLELQPQQLLRANSARNRQFEAIVDLTDGSISRFETKEHESVSLPPKGGDFGISTTPLFTGAGATPDTVYLVDLKTGKAHLLFEEFWGNVGFSPTGRWLTGFDSETDQSFVIDVRTRRKIDVSAKVPFPIYDFEDDHPSGGGPYGQAGWNEDDSVVYVYDKFDIWQVPLLEGEAKNVTRGWGRTSNRTFRYMNTDRDQEFIDPSKPVLLSVFDNEYKDAGFYSHTFDSSMLPTELVLSPHYFGFPTKARDADVLMFTRETAVESRNVFVSGTDFKNPRQLSDSNPQQKDYNWLTTELVEWVSLDGDRLQGIVFKPENIDYSKKYPMITYFYEKDSDTINRYRSPSPSASTINIPLFVSQGYVVFVPDIPYKIGYPGESAVSAIVSGVNRVLADGYVDKDRLGIQGQSWGGYQVAYLVTETDMFAAAGAGAPVANMFSAYGGIRWGSGLVRQLQYESGQSRIGGTMWEYPLRYLENSPIFFADKVKTPLLIMANDKDGAVPYWQGIEYFTALHRLKKPSWLLVYNGEDHNLIQRKNRKDLSIRLSQFFDHYLKGEPMPVWMSNGIPATEKGKTMGYELTKGGK